MHGDARIWDESGGRGLPLREGGGARSSHQPGKMASVTIIMLVAIPVAELRDTETPHIAGDGKEVSKFQRKHQRVAFD